MTTQNINSADKLMTSRTAKFAPTFDYGDPVYRSIDIMSMSDPFIDGAVANNDGILTGGSSVWSPIVHGKKALSKDPISLRAPDLEHSFLEPSHFYVCGHFPGVLSHLRAALDKCGVDKTFEEQSCTFSCEKYSNFHALRFVVHLYHCGERHIVEFQRRSRACHEFGRVFDSVVASMTSIIVRSNGTKSLNIAQSTVCPGSGQWSSPRSQQCHASHPCISGMQFLPLLDLLKSAQSGDLQAQGVRLLAQITTVPSINNVEAAYSSMLSSLPVFVDLLASCSPSVQLGAASVLANLGGIVSSGGRTDETSQVIAAPQEPIPVTSLDIMRRKSHSFSGMVPHQIGVDTIGEVRGNGVHSAPDPVESQVVKQQNNHQHEEEDKKQRRILVANNAAQVIQPLLSQLMSSKCIQLRRECGRALVGWTTRCGCAAALASSQGGERVRAVLMLEQDKCLTKYLNVVLENIASFE